MNTWWLHCYNSFCICSCLCIVFVCSNNMQLMSVQIFLPDSMKVKKGGNYPYICQLPTWLATFLTSLGALKWKSLQKTWMLHLVSIMSYSLCTYIFTLATYVPIYTIRITPIKPLLHAQYILLLQWSLCIGTFISIHPCVSDLGVPQCVLVFSIYV